MNISYCDSISVDDYRMLRASAGWRPVEYEQAEAGLAGSAFVVAAKDGDKIVGTARVVWDGGYGALVKDVLVLPEYQGAGIGKTMMELLLDYLKSKMKDGWWIDVDLMAAFGKEGFYEKLGFSARPRENRGPGMNATLTSN